jgi:hypothetical protein
MTRRLEFSLSPRRLFPLFIGFFIPFAALYAVTIVFSLRAQTQPGSSWVSLAVSLACAAGFFLLYVLFAVPVLRRAVPALSVGGVPLAFQGRMGPFVGMNVLGAFLSLITVGVYYPWYIARVTRWLAENTSLDGKPWGFAGKGGRLFVILLLTLVIPMVVLAVIAGIAAAASVLGGGGSLSGPSPMLLTQLLTVVIVILIFPAYMYELYRWLFVNLRIGDARVAWSTRFWPAVGFILLQVFLTVITVLIYGPAAYVRGYRYFARRTTIVREGSADLAVGFDGSVGQGFGVIWGRSLLCLITLGIYSPWAAARIGAWFARHTTVEEAGPAAPTA